MNPAQRDEERLEAPAYSSWFAIVCVLFGAGVTAFSFMRPLDKWDESRNVNNALEMAMGGHWMVPMYAWAPDHWNTKPPLLTWIQALLIRAGLPSLLAARIPAIVAGMAVVVLLFWFCKHMLQRPFAGVVSGMLLMSSSFYFGLHMAISGDFDALLCLLTTVCTLAFWKYVEDEDPRALLVAGASLCLAILTKSVAGLFPLPGIFLFAVFCGRAKRILTDWRLWVTLGGALALAASYYVLRDRWFDPGYLRVVWANELAGRYGEVNEGHQTHWYFYFRELLKRFEPGMALVPLGLLALRRDYGERPRSAALLAALVPLTLLLILSTSATREVQYCASAVPLLALFSGLGVDAALGFLQRRAVRLWPVRVAVLAVLTFTVMLVLGRVYTRRHQPSEQLAYQPALARLRQMRLDGPVQIIDSGIPNSAGLVYYSPMALFYATEAQRHGLKVGVQGPEGAVPQTAWILSCDPAATAWLRQAHGLKDTVPLPGDCWYGHAVQ